jgi:lipoyl(octanoyl) transferase
MDIEIKKSVKPVNYKNAINLLENRVKNLIQNKGKELIWFLEHKAIFTAGTSYNEKEIIEDALQKKEFEIYENNL